MVDRVSANTARDSFTKTLRGGLCRPEAKFSSFLEDNGNARDGDKE